MIVRRVRPEDWRAVRALRLTALEEFPLAFAERLGEAQAKPDERWQARTRVQAESDRDLLAVAETADGEIVATTGGFVDTARPRCVTVYSVYVAPAWRGRRVADALLDHVRGWATGLDDVTDLALLVFSENERAIAAYTRLGFADTGVATPHPLDPRKSEREMRMSLAAVGRSR